LAEARSDPRLRAIPIIVLTGSELPQDVEQCFRLGANAYVIKPGSPARAQALIKALEEFWFVQGRTPSPV
jgi:CheY-like chemotaxis protein